jgi:hypothetical protein
VVTTKTKLAILLNNGTGEFSEPVYYPFGYNFYSNDGLAVHDFTGDGNLDIAVTNWEEDIVIFYPGFGNGTFGNRQESYVGNKPLALTAGNFNPILTPDLHCEGDITWFDVVPGSNVSGSFTIENSGDPYSYLNWEIESFPGWGTWVFTPSNGYNLTPDDGVLTVVVDVTTPEEKNTELTGEIKIVNADNMSNYCIIDIVLETPKSNPFNINLNHLNSLFEQFPLLQKILDILRLNRR